MKRSPVTNLVAARDVLPLAERLPEPLTAFEAFERLSRRSHVVFLDSAAVHPEQGRYSFVAAEPFEWIELTSGEQDPLSILQQRLAHFKTAGRRDLPPFQGGAAGLLGYELGSTLEDVPLARCDDLPMPVLAMGLYDVVLAFDHVAGESWIVSQGFPEHDALARGERARTRIAQFLEWLQSPPAPSKKSDEPSSDIILSSRRIPVSQLAPQFSVGVMDGISSNLSADAYRKIVRQAIEYIRAGDVFQVNLSQRLLARRAASPLELYRRLRSCNPAPYAGFLDLGDRHICSASPECFLKVRDRQVETRPIKGTRGRPRHPEADLYAGDELRVSEKDLAENVMIVDLMRNDLSRVCTDPSVHVAELFGLESFAYVKHLVSSVRGELRDGLSQIDLVRAAFPGGSITGAPKIRAMEIIADVEPTVRGPYCGSLAYLGFDGQMDASILIRTITSIGGWWQMPVGGGIVAQSNPDDEYRETWHKARGLLKAIH